MISGSAPLWPHIIERWKEISGHNLLERYGTTETGMVLGSPLIGERKPGFVGQPVPGVNVRITKKDCPEKVSNLGHCLIFLKMSGLIKNQYSGARRRRLFRK